MEEQDPPTPITHTAKFWFSGLERAVEFEILENDLRRFKSYLSDPEAKEFFEFDTPGHTVVLANMAHVDAVKLTSLPTMDPLASWDEEPSEAVIQLVGRFEAFSASTSEEHLGPDHPVRQLLGPDTGSFVQWLDARGQTVVMNPKKLSYLEHPKYWIENAEGWTDNTDFDDEMVEDEESDSAQAEVEEGATT
ncbi:MAG: hypothetical protein WC423_18115 [Vulcanimicrobiota bacterium]